MPMPNLSIPQFPDVPNLPGVPALARSIASQAGAGVNRLAALVGLPPIVTLAQPVWGVFDDQNRRVAIADSVRSMDYSSESRISDYPQEAGAFESYNKVKLPYSATVIMTVGGDMHRRSVFLSDLQKAKDSTDLYSIVTPEATYLNANIVGMRYSRTQRDGATLLTAELHIEEVRDTATAAFADNTKNPASSDPVSLGQVQAQPPTAAQSALFGPTSVVQGTTSPQNVTFTGAT